MPQCPWISSTHSLSPPWQVKRNLLNVSYHIAQYTSIIADLRSEIQRLQRKIEQQEPRPMRSDIRSIQGRKGEGCFCQDMDTYIPASSLLMPVVASCLTK